MLYWWDSLAKVYKPCMLYVQPLLNLQILSQFSTSGVCCMYHWVQLEVNVDVMCNNPFSVQRPTISGSTCAAASIIGNPFWTVFILSLTDFKHGRLALLGQILDIHPTFSI